MPTNGKTPSREPPSGSRATIRAHPERDATDQAAQFLVRGLVAHVGFVADGQPVIIPMTYHFSPDDPKRLYLHGSRESRLMARVASGEPVCVAVTLVDGLVYSRTANDHSVNYRSVVIFARASAEQPDPAAQRGILEAMIGRYFPGRRAGVDYDAIPDAHLSATACVALDVEEWSAKARRGGPNGPNDGDPQRPGTAGVIELGGSGGMPEEGDTT